MNEEQQNQPHDHPEDEPQHAKSTEGSHPLATSLGAVGGSVAGAALGRSIIGGKVGTAIGGVVGAIALGASANKLAEFAQEAIDEIQPSGLGFGANDKPIELPRHYNWEELKALSKPQKGEIHHA